MNILFISGVYPPEACGIGDYTYKLVTAMEMTDTNIHVLANISWSLSNFSEVSQQIKNINPDVIHIQYPSVGFGTSLIPQLLSLRYKTVVTIHEFSQAHILRKISLLPFSLRADLIFTNGFEQKAFNKLFFWSRRINKQVIIPIGSNIKPNNNEILFTERDNNTIVNFGQIRPNKGLEDIVSLARQIKQKNLQYKVLVLGQVLGKFEDYYKSLREESKDLRIEWKINESEETISNILSGNLIAYLPFPDGASERRGSLLAALANKMLVFTTTGEQTTDALKEIIIDVPSINNLVEYLGKQPQLDFYAIWRFLTSASSSYIKKLDWANISDLHLDFYKTTIN